jgi:hypothetical protein
MAEILQLIYSANPANYGRTNLTYPIPRLGVAFNPLI